MQIDEPILSNAPSFALWNLGFRPFYLLASSFATLTILLWIGQYAGLLGSYMPSPAWHAHEMLFGFTSAVIAGFLFTAVRAWSNQTTPTGAWLAACAALWVAGRVLVMTPFAISAAVVNAAFPVAVAIGIGIPLIHGQNKRNYFFIPLLLMFGSLTMAMHLTQMGVVEWPPQIGLRTGLDLVLFIIAVIGGRVIPMFTNNGIPGCQARRIPWVEKTALGGVLLLMLADLLPLPSAVIGVLCFVLALTHAVRMFLWQSWRTFRTPLVWILHAAYVWIVVYLVLRGLAAFSLVSELIAIHALTIGTIGGMTIGMMTRTARGHTGRALKADAYEITAFALIQMAVLIRVLGGIALPAYYFHGIVIAGVCWSLAFGIYTVRYWPILSQARIDGRPG